MLSRFFRWFSTWKEKVKWVLFEIPVDYEHERYLCNTFTGEDPLTNNMRLNNYECKRMDYESNFEAQVSEPKIRKGNEK
jgi:hypothetical protein